MKGMKRVKLGVLAALVMLLLAAFACAMAEENFPFTTVTNDQVNMRRSASSTATILERVQEGDSITVLGEKGNYYKISYKNRTGYVLKKYVSTSADVMVTPVPTAVPTATGYPYDTTTSDSVNLREKQSVYARKLASIPKGATITVEKISGTFAKVTYKGIEGWCKKDYINLKQIVKVTPTPTPVPTLAPAENASSYQVLQKGSKGSHVTALQEALTELGFLSGKADGVFGAGTQNAVIAFQKANAYPDTGLVDANLQAFLYSGKPKNVKGVKTQIKTLAPVEGVTVRLNNRGALVRTIQTRLKELGYYAGEITGVYDKTTRNAAKAFQKSNGLTADGICGAKTQSTLLGNNALAAGATATPSPSPTPTPAPTFQIPSDTVRRGDQGLDARLVQQRLKDLKYLTGKVDGIFGSDSVEALKAFQKKHGLEDDGVAGQSTFSKLFSHNALGKNDLPTPKPTAAPTIAPPAATATLPVITEDNVVVIRKGTTGNAVKNLQKRLTDLGYYDATVDGTCKNDDVAAIRAFQKNNGLKADGVAGYDTQSKLYSASAITHTGAIAGGTVDTFTTLRRGMSGTEVENLQKRLIALKYLTGKADGKYGQDTAEAVYAFQKQNGLVRDGVAGPATLAKIYSATTASAPTAAPTATPKPTTLRKGDVSNAVRRMQQRLIDMGYLSGTADGKFGSATYRALKNFQRLNGLSADGVAGAKTLAMLSSANAVGADGAQIPSVQVSTSTSGGTGTIAQVKPSNVIYKNWYKGLRDHAKKYPYATVYDFATGISWQVHMFSFGAHADAEPLTAADTAKMERAFGGNTWNPKAVWVIFGDGSIYIASTHSMPHLPQHRTDNNFNGHVCIHFPRTASQVASIGSYATSHQKSIDKGWALTQSMK